MIPRLFRYTLHRIVVCRPGPAFRAGVADVRVPEAPVPHPPSERGAGGVAALARGVRLALFHRQPAALHGQGHLRRGGHQLPGRVPAHRRIPGADRIGDPWQAEADEVREVVPGAGAHRSGGAPEAVSRDDRRRGARPRAVRRAGRPRAARPRPRLPGNLPAPAHRGVELRAEAVRRLHHGGHVVEGRAEDLLHPVGHRRGSRSSSATTWCRSAWARCRT